MQSQGGHGDLPPTPQQVVSSSVKTPWVVLLAARLAGVRGCTGLMTSDAVLRQVRVLTLPSVLFASGLAGHAAAGGATPGTSVLIPLYLLTVVLAAPFASASTSPARAVALVAGGQALLHAALQLLGRSAVPATTTMCGSASHMAAMPSAPDSHMMMHHCAAGAHGPALAGMS